MSNFPQFFGEQRLPGTGDPHIHGWDNPGEGLRSLPGFILGSVSLIFDVAAGPHQYALVGYDGGNGAPQLGAEAPGATEELQNHGIAVADHGVVACRHHEAGLYPAAVDAVGQVILVIETTYLEVLFRFQCRD